MKKIISLITFIVLLVFNSFDCRSTSCCCIKNKIDIGNITFSKSFLDEIFTEIKKPHQDQKNGMVVFPHDSVNKNSMIKFASSAYPPMTKYPDPSFIELVDVLLPNSANELKRLSLLNSKLNDLKNKKAAYHRNKKDNKSAFDAALAVVNGLIENFNIKSINQTLADVEAKLIIILNEYRTKLIGYFDVLRKIEPSALHNKIDIAKKIVQDKIISSINFTKSIKDSNDLRELVHTEDIILYCLKKKIYIEKLNSFMFSRLDLCSFCRIKWSYHKKCCNLFPDKIVFNSIDKCGNTTVDYIYDSKFSKANKAGHQKLSNICQIRFSNFKSTDTCCPSNVTFNIINDFWKK